MTRAGLASLAAHVVVVALLLLGHMMVGRAPLREADDPAQIDLVLGKGGATDEPPPSPPAAFPAPPTPPPQAPPPPEPPPPEPAPPEPPPAERTALEPMPSDAPPEPLPVERDLSAPPIEVAPPAPSLPSLSPVEAAPSPSPVTPPSPVGAPPGVQLGDGSRRPYGDLLDPDHSRFRPAMQDSGNLMPSYPRAAAARLESGTVKLQLFVDPSGRVANVIIVRSSGSELLDNAAREQLLTWRFAPARRDGRAVPDVVAFEISFELF